MRYYKEHKIIQTYPVLLSSNFPGKEKMVMSPEKRLGYPRSKTAGKQACPVQGQNKPQKEIVASTKEKTTHPIW